MTRRVMTAAVMIAAITTTQGLAGEIVAEARVGDLAAAVEFGDAKAKIEAINAVAKSATHARAAGPILVKMTADPSRAIRLAATVALGQIRATSPQARAALAKASKGDDPEIALAAREALKLIQRYIALTLAPTSRPAVRKLKIVLGFSQIGSESDWRVANTKSIKAEAKHAIDAGLNRYTPTQGSAVLQQAIAAACADEFGWGDEHAYMVTSGVAGALTLGIMATGWMNRSSNTWRSSERMRVAVPREIS